MPASNPSGKFPTRRRRYAPSVEREEKEESETRGGACPTGSKGGNTSSGGGETVSSEEVSDGRNSFDSSHAGSSDTSNPISDAGSQLTGPSFGTNNAAVKLASSNSVCTETTAEQSYREHQADVGAHVCMKNLKELAKRKGTNEVFRLFKFPPKEIQTSQMKVFKVAVLKSMGMINTNNITRDKFERASEKLKDLLPSVKVGMRNKRASVVEACDLEIQRACTGFLF